MMILSYVKSSNLGEARQLFDGMLERTVVTWPILIGGYSQKNQFKEAFELFVQMQRHGTELDYVPFVILLSRCNGHENFFCPCIILSPFLFLFFPEKVFFLK